MNARRARLLWCLAAVSALALVLASHFRRPAPPDASWDCPRLAREMCRLGYEVHDEPRDRYLGRPEEARLVSAGLYFCRPGADWEAEASRTLGARWKGVVVAKPRGGFSPGDDALAVGPWLLFGDPDELARVADGLGLR